jgi:uncharacterized DUF497 family protein
LNVFTIRFQSDSQWEDLERLNISLDEVQRLFYGEDHVFYPNIQNYMIIGYIGSKMLSADFDLDFESNLITVTEINYPTNYAVKTHY